MILRSLELIAALLSASTTESSTTATSSIAQQIAELRAANEALSEEIDRLSAEQQSLGESILELLALKGRLSGYLDAGAFVVAGDGSGIRSDLGFERFPEYRGIIPDSWVFVGDPLSTAVNSRGEPADTGESRAVTYDPIDNQGKPSFIVNSLSLALFAGLGEDLTLNAIIDFLPRGRDVSDPDGTFLGDHLDVKLAYADYFLGFDSWDLTLTVGKMDSVVGIEYRIQESPDRFGVTPSLICRYTCGHPVGLKARSRFFDGRLIVNFAVTNGAHFSELFPFFDEIDHNVPKTAAGRVSYQLPLGAGLEIGLSGAFGAQDGQSDAAVPQWHAGADLHLEIGDLDLTAEYVQGKARGASEDGAPACGISPCLEYRGAYGQLAYRFTNWFAPYVRVDGRDALHTSGASFVYVSQLLRVTGGARFEAGQHVIFKAEYIYNHELGGIPQFADDIITSSIVIRF